MKNLHKLTAVLAALLLTVGALWIPLQARQESSSSADRKANAPTAEESSAASGPAPEATGAGEGNGRSLRGDELLRKVREQLNGYSSIQAKLIERVQIGERSFRAEGTYLQGSNLKSRLEFDVKLAEAAGGLEASLLQVCDGQVLWTQHTIGQEPRITRRDVQQILQAAQAGGDYSENVLSATLGLGGLPAMLASIEKTMVFRRVQREEIGDETYLQIAGTWKQRVLDRWQVPRDPEEAYPRLPIHVPERVRIHVQKEPLFPRRIQFLKRPPEEDYFRPMVTLDLVDVVLNAPIDDEKFYFVPPDDVMQQDVTNNFLQLLRSRQPQQPGQPPAGPGPQSAPPGQPPTQPGRPGQQPTQEPPFGPPRKDSVPPTGPAAN